MIARGVSSVLLLSLACGACSTATDESGASQPWDSALAGGGGASPAGTGGARSQAGNGPSGAGGGTAGPSDYHAVGTCKAGSTDGVRVCLAKLGVTLKYSGGAANERYSDTQAGYADQLLANAVRGDGGYHAVRGATPFDGHTVAEVKQNPNVLDWGAIDTFYSGDRQWFEWAKREPGRLYYNSTRWWRNQASAANCDSGEYVLGNDADPFWISVFAWAYWANVKNGYDLTHIEVSNEPDNCGGNGGTQTNVQDHDRMMVLAKDALGYVNQNLVKPAKPAIIVGPGNLSAYNGKAWIESALNDPTTNQALDVVSFHSYWGEHWADEIGSGTGMIDGLPDGKQKKRWITEWGQFWYPQGYSDPAVVPGMAFLIPKLGLWGVEQQMVWALHTGCCGSANLVSDTGQRSTLFWIMRMLHRALLSEKDMLQTNLANNSGDPTFAYATRDATDLYVIYMNPSTSAHSISIELDEIPRTDGARVTWWSVGMTTDEKSLPDGAVASGRISLQAAAQTYYVGQIHGAGTQAQN